MTPAGYCSAEAASTNFGSSRTGVIPTSTGGQFNQSYDLGVPSLQGIYRVCYCPNYNGCDDDCYDCNDCCDYD